MTPPVSRENDPDIVRREYATEDRFLARRLAAKAELHGPLVEDAAVAAVAGLAPGRLLDVGCGTGDFTERLSDVAGLVVGLDLSPRMAKLTGARGLPALTGDTEALPFVDAALDVVVANRVLYHLPDLDRGVAEMARVLCPGGTVVAITYGERHLGELWDLVGQNPLATSQFSAENGADAFGRHFGPVERHDITGTARFRDADSVRRYFDSYGEFVDVGSSLADRVPTPFDATYRHALFVARRPP